MIARELWNISGAPIVGIGAVLSESVPEKLWNIWVDVTEKEAFGALLLLLLYGLEADQWGWHVCLCSLQGWLCLCAR